MKNIFLLILLMMSVHLLNAQDSLLDALGDEEKTTDYITNAFKSPRVINGNSMEMLAEGALDFRINHRFGDVTQGYKELFGLDQASMRMSFDYGILPNLMVGIGRSTNKKELDGMFKYRILWQSKGKRNMPISLLWASGMMINGSSNPTGSEAVEATFARRLAYYHQIIVGRKFSERFTLQLTPTLVHRNLVANELEPNDLLSLGLGLRYKFSKRVAFVLDYYHNINSYPNSIRYNPLSIGFDIETGGHVFQLHLSNSPGMNERAFIADDNNNIFKGQIHFGFNLSRVFQIANKKEY